jgi:hypothetical protein
LGDRRRRWRKPERGWLRPWGQTACPGGQSEGAAKIGGPKTRCTSGEEPVEDTLRVVVMQRGHHEETFYFTSLSLNSSPVLNHDTVTPYLFLFAFIVVVGEGKLWHLWRFLQCIKYIISESSPFTALLYPGPIPGIFSTTIIFALHLYEYVSKILDHIQPSIPFSHHFPHPTVTIPTTTMIAPGQDLFCLSLKGKKFWKVDGFVRLFNVGRKDFLTGNYLCMHVCIYLFYCCAGDTLCHL